MQVTETLSDGLKRGFTVVVPAADIETRRTARLADLSKTIQLPGFRPGKVPMPVVRQRYGKAVTAEIMEQSVTDATRQVMEERGLRPALQPKVDLVDPNLDLGAGHDLAFNVEVEVLPDITMPDFAALTLTRLKAEVAPDVVEQQLSQMAQRNRELQDIAPEDLGDRGAEKGEVLTVDFLGKVDDQPFPGGEGKDLDVEVGGAGFIPGFTEQMEGMKPGETRTIAVTFPDPYGAKELAGKAATFEVTAKRLRKPLVPQIDDAFAQKLAFDNVQELRDFMQRRVQQEYDGLSRQRLKRDLLDALSEQASFVAPQGVVDREFEQIWQRLESERAQGQLDDDDKNKDDTTLRSEYRAIADRRVRLGLLMAEIGRINTITVTPDELTRGLRVEASRYPGREAEMMQFFQKYPAMTENIRGQILEEKVVDYVLELAQVTDKSVTPDELAQEPPMLTAGGSQAAGSADAAGTAAAGTDAGAEAQPAGDSTPTGTPEGTNAAEGEGTREG
jgi:trigger factor